MWQMILIHVEIQGDRDSEFPERMYICRHRAYERYRKPVVGLAILADEEPGWRVSEYRLEMFGSEVIYRFNTVKLLDYLKRLPELEASDNPFAIVTLAHLRAKQTKNRMEERYQHRWYITRSLLKHGFSHQEIIDLNKFIEWILSLPPKDEKRFWEELSNCEEGQKMPYITNADRVKIQFGEQKGKAEMLLDLLQDRFGLVPEPIQKQVVSADLNDINIWARKIFKADSLQAIFH
ncbi:MAG: hypothetical protein HQL93_05370 [Magnetococcales bacterium]|nr:hypothetical protein [Magnetococcales bacterium]